MTHNVKQDKIPVIAVVGPTAAGKTAMGIELAKRFGGEIVSCDSMQIYRGLDIGTAKPSVKELAQVKHHMIGFLDTASDYSVSDYVADAGEVIRTLHEQEKYAVLVGGTGLYARSLLRGVSFDENCRDDALRRTLEKEAAENGIQPLYERLKEIDAKAAEGIHPNNQKRVIRALEYCLVSNRPFSRQAEESKQAESDFAYVMLCLSFRDRKKLYERINRRVDAMLENGLLDEAKAFYESLQGKQKLPTAAQAIGYKELFPYFEGKTGLTEAVENMKQSTRRYAKRQLTWFRREEDIDFVYIDDYPNEAALFSACAGRVENSGILKEK